MYEFTKYFVFKYIHILPSSVYWKGLEIINSTIWTFWAPILFSSKRIQGFSGNFLIKDLRQEIHRMNLAYLIIPESKKLKTMRIMLKKKNMTQEPTWRGFRVPKINSASIWIMIMTDWNTSTMLKYMGP